ncbi:thymosin beta isoform X2 [Frankliniella occidentalis]|uniref:Thymosin beta isoform X2 n=2 Tax=Frankliniella occidentalis TaxID=133901 RepID=A0A9C6WLU1_FRAOC|nr:thymosin beta isoform X2 [Frankliniella occidentalis]
MTGVTQTRSSSASAPKAITNTPTPHRHPLLGSWTSHTLWIKNSRPEKELCSASIMSSPSLNELPKVAVDLKSQLEGFNPSNMKHAVTQEKTVLPTAEDVASEKTQKALIEGVEAFDSSKLKPTETQEKNLLPDKDVVQQERAHQNLLNGVEHFDKSSMKHAETQEKNPLPDPAAIEQEKGQQQLIAGIENFNPKSLKHTETQEKNPLPTKEAIAQEKGA